VIWLANDMTVRRLSGITPVRISTEAVERSIRQSTWQDGFAFSTAWGGHLWYVFTMPEVTWLYDATTQQWFEHRSHGQDNWRVSCAAESGGITYVGDSLSGKLGKFDDVFTEWGNPLRMEWTYPAVYSEGERAVHSRFEIVTEAATDLAEGQGSDPEMMLAYSDDGKVFTWLPSRKLGRIGEHKRRVVWWRLGQSRNRVYRAAYSEPIRRKIADSYLYVTDGTLG
jgi:hypothetical protein